MIETKVGGLDPLVKKFKAMEKRGKNLAPVLRVIDELLDRHVEKNFETQGAHGGRAWAALKRSTITARTRRWGYYRRRPRGASPSGPVLQWTQGLKQSWQKGKKDHIRILTRRSLRWGSAHPAAPFHQKGKGRRKRQMLRFANSFQRREITARPISMYLMGVPVGAIRTIMRARQG